MIKSDFEEFYKNVILHYAMEFVKNNKGYHIIDDSQRIYEEYVNQKTCMKMLLEKESDVQLLDRHKVCAAMTVAIIKSRIVSYDFVDDLNGKFKLTNASKINEQIAFYSSWSLLIAFLSSKNENRKEYVLPQTSHNEDFSDTFSRSLFYADVQNSLCPELIANIYFLLEAYNNEK